MGSVRTNTPPSNLSQFFDSIVESGGMYSGIGWYDFSKALLRIAMFPRGLDGEVQMEYKYF